MEVNIGTDTDGFLSQECPSCIQRFKVKPGEGSDEPISYCPHCGHNGQECWHTPEQVEYAQSVAIDTVVAPELKKLQRQMKRASNGFFKINLDLNLPKPSDSPIETDEPLAILHFPCCDETVKLRKQEQHFCIICGTEINMTESDSKRVFLSHKGVDKSQVKDFKDTLNLLGYEPWLDEDAMPAGTSLERGLLQGMQDSCGVVFFITPSFKDEGYLRTEIDYAIQEQRKKEDKFSIITLQFVDEDGKVGSIPELLKGYVWKTPTTQLEALREIVRALPIASKLIDWREGVAGVVTTPLVKSTSKELSDEAKSILKTAISDDGRIMYISSMHTAGKSITAGGQSMIPNYQPRTVALWHGGIEDLRRRGFIKDVGSKGEIFKVTREGYEAADNIAVAE